MKIFPKKIEMGTVLLYTDKGWYGSIPTPPSGVPIYEVAYLAISSYDGESEFFLCCLDEKYKVLANEGFTSVQECLQRAKSSAKSLGTDEIKWHSHPYVKF